jgi:gluconolactonase
MSKLIVSEVQPKLFVTGQNFPEGPNFDAQGNLFVCNRWDGFIVKVRPDGQYSPFVATGGKPNGSRLHRDGRLFIADIGRRQILAAEPDGTLAVVIDAFEGKPLLGPNDLIFDKNGALYFTDPGLESKESFGQVFRWTPDGSLTLLASDLVYPNGIALSPDESLLYVAETGTNRVSRYDIRTDGTLGGRELFVQFQEGEGPQGRGPDGMAFGADENLYVAHRGSGSVIVVDPEGEIIAQIPAGGALPTNMAFWEDSLYVTEDETAAVYRLDIGVRGLPLFHQRKG